MYNNDSITNNANKRDFVQKNVQKQDLHRCAYSNKREEDVRTSEADWFVDGE